MSFTHKELDSIIDLLSSKQLENITLAVTQIVSQGSKYTQEFREICKDVVRLFEENIILKVGIFKLAFYVKYKTTIDLKLMSFESVKVDLPKKVKAAVSFLIYNSPSCLVEVGKYMDWNRDTFKIYHINGLSDFETINVLFLPLDSYKICETLYFYFAEEIKPLTPEEIELEFKQTSLSSLQKILDNISLQP